MAGQASTDMLMCEEALWGAGMSLEKSKGAFLCLQGGIHEKEKCFSADRWAGQAALSAGQDSSAGLGTEDDTEGSQSVCGVLFQDLLDLRAGVLQFH